MIDYISALLRNMKQKEITLSSCLLGLVLRFSLSLRVRFFYLQRFLKIAPFLM